MTDQHERSQPGRQVLLSPPFESSRSPGFPASRDAAVSEMEHHAEYWVTSNALPANVLPRNAARYHVVYTNARIRFSCVFNNKKRHSTSVSAEDRFDHANPVWSGHLVPSECDSSWPSRIERLKSYRSETYTMPSRRACGIMWGKRGVSLPARRRNNLGPVETHAI